MSSSVSRPSSKTSSPTSKVAPPRRSGSATPPQVMTTDDSNKDVEWNGSWQPPLTITNAVFASSSVVSSTSSALPIPLPRPVTQNLLPTYKILLIGDAGVGKSNLLNRFANNSFDIASRSTIGVEFVSREVELPTERDGSMEKVNIQLWDTAGQERCGAISAAFFRNAKGVVVVYDSTRYQSLKNVPGWVAHAKQYADENCAFVVIGNKVDLKNLQAVAEEEAEGVAHSLGLRHFYTSALTGDGVPAAFLHLILMVNSMVRSQQIASPKLQGSSSYGGGNRMGGQRVPVDISGVGNTSGEPSSGKKCCR